jgi:hypothetical protein
MLLCVLLKWNDAKTDANSNLEGASVCCVLPDVHTDSIILILKADNEEMSNEYKLVIQAEEKEIYGQTAK